MPVDISVPLDDLGVPRWTVGTDGLIRELSSPQGPVVMGFRYSPSVAGAVSFRDEISSPLEIANCELWLDAISGCVDNNYAQPANGQSVTTWLDGSGNVRHATIAAGTPTFSESGGHGGKPGVQFGAGTRMVTPAFVTSAYGNAITVFVVSKEGATPHSSLKIKASISTANFWIGNIGTTKNRDITISGLTGFTQTTGVVPVLGGIDHASVSPSVVAVCTDGFGRSGESSVSTFEYAISAGSVPFTNGAVTIGGLAGSSTYDWPGTISEVIVFSRALSADEVRRVRSYLSRKWDSTKTVVLVGNSLTSGTGSTGGATQIPSATGSNLASLLMAQYGASVRVRNDAYPGRTADQMVAQVPYFSNVFADAADTISVVWEGTNSLATYASPNKALEDIRRVCLLKRGPGKKVIVGTVLYRGDTANDTRNFALTDQLNMMIRNSYTDFADDIVDYAADPRLQDYTNTTYFDVDQIHLKDAGYVVCRDILSTVLANHI